MQVTVEPEALAEWSAHARRTAGSLTGRLGGLDDGLTPLVRSWQGPAAAGFVARHEQWRSAASGLLTTLAALATLVDTAAANYRAAASANTRIWHAGPGSTAVVLEAMARRGRGKLSADLEEVRGTVVRLVAALEGLATAWQVLATGLAGTAAMAGGDDVGTAFAGRYDAMAGVAWEGWRSTVLLLDGIAGGLAATANNVARAERDSTPGAGPAFTPVTASTAPTPAPALPVVGGGAPGGLATGHWPTADPALLREAARAWRAAAEGLREAVRHAFDAVDGLAAASPDLVLQRMRAFTRAALSDDPTAGLTGVLADTGVRIATACEGLADLTERTRARILATLTYYAAGEPWYHPLADVIDLIVRFKVAHALAAAGDAYLLDLDLSTIHDEHVREADLVRSALHPAAVDHLARLATAMAPPRLVSASTCAVTSPDGAAGAPVPESQRQALIAEVAATSDRIEPDDVLQIARGWDGRPVWIARGDASAGLRHLLRPERILAFLDRGVAPSEIPGVALRAVAQGPPIGRPKRRDDAEDAELRRRGREPGYVYAVDLGRGRRLTMVVIRADNGFVVTAFPYNGTVHPL